MSVKEVRPFPVSATVVMRSTLFALANMGAKLHTYNEETGFVVASVSKWMGLQKNEVVARVRDFEKASQLELEAPDAEKAYELLQLIGSYVSDGAKIQANATIQWVDMARQQAQKEKRQAVVNRVKNLLPGGQAETSTEIVPVSDTETALVTSEDSPNAITPVNPATDPIPDNPGVLVKNRNDQLIELKVDPETFTDRTAFMETCKHCAALSLRGSTYCASCGRPLTLDAIQGDASKAASSSFNASLIGLAFHAVPLVMLIIPAFFLAADGTFMDRIGASLDMIRITLSLLLGLLPAVFFGWRAISQSQRASWYLNLGAKRNSNEGTKVAVGNALGWLDIYLAVVWVVFVVIALL
ncbi:MAG: hypothetical protein AAF614_31145 [Chloroflexota bacterium]